MISSAALQWIALITMTLDHIGLYFFPNQILFRIIGRIAMPIFVFTLAEGFIHTKSRQKYFMRLGMLGVISEIVMILMRQYTGYDLQINVVMTLALCFIAMLCAERGGVGWFGVAAIAVAAYLFNFEYGAPAVLLAVAFYFICNLRDFHVTYAVTLALALGAFAYATTINSHWTVQAYSALAFVPLAFYSGEKGRRIPYRLNYWYYPAHLLVLLAIRLMLL